MLEFYGCEWHGCDDCYTPHTYSLITGRKMGDLLTNTLNREALLRGSRYELESTWECRWRSLLQGDPETTQMYNTYVEGDLENFQDLLHPREALFGGRVNCYQMFFKSFEGS